LYSRIFRFSNQGTTKPPKNLTGAGFGSRVLGVGRSWAGGCPGEDEAAVLFVRALPGALSSWRRGTIFDNLKQAGARGVGPGAPNSERRTRRSYRFVPAGTAWDRIIFFSAQNGGRKPGFRSVAADQRTPPVGVGRFGPLQKRWGPSGRRCFLTSSPSGRAPFAGSEVFPHGQCAPRRLVRREYTGRKLAATRVNSDKPA
jgi:hypothetical protein